MSRLDPNKVYEADTTEGHMTAQLKDGLVTLTLDTNYDGTPDITTTGRYIPSGSRFSPPSIPTTVNGMNVGNSAITAEAVRRSEDGFSEGDLGYLAPLMVSALHTAEIENGVPQSTLPVRR